MMASFLHIGPNSDLKIPLSHLYMGTTIYLEYVKKVLTRTHTIDVCRRRETKSPSRLLSLQSMVDSAVENRNYDSS